MISSNRDELEMSPNMLSTAYDLPRIDELTEVLTCSICLDIFFEPCTTRCGHSFCNKCFQSSIYKSGRRCPICRQLISKGESYNLNTVLWKTVKQMFPREVKERKTMDDLDRQAARTRNLLEFIDKWYRRMFVAVAGMTATTFLAINIWLIFNIKG